MKIPKPQATRSPARKTVSPPPNAQAHSLGDVHGDNTCVWRWRAPAAGAVLRQVHVSAAHVSGGLNLNPVVDGQRLKGIPISEAGTNIGDISVAPHQEVALWTGNGGTARDVWITYYA
jgi:hypothetical protein